MKQKSLAAALAPECWSSLDAGEGISTASVDKMAMFLALDSLWRSLSPLIVSRRLARCLP
ncbi:MAG: hypothetical protein F4X92_08745 [Gammaproteobacteria bacterium]|nr:hypothetical protein [Gammaproteobacteria bacterium]